MTTVRRWQVGLLLFGLALLAVGGVVLLQEVSPKKYLGIIAWFIGALIIHDGIIAPTVFLTTLFMRKFGARVPAVVMAIIQGALVIGGIITLIVLPEIVKKAVGTLSSSILPSNYGLNLVVFYAVLIVLAAIGVAAYLLMFRSRQKLRPSADQA